MQLQVRGLSTHTLECNEDETISSIKARAAALEMIPPEHIRLYSAGSPLNDDITVSQLQNFDLELTIPLIGGKVHGSLARAGKVKGQTPKVEKQEKRKKKTGRAKRRIQYNRHFISSVQTFGRRKGPNSRT
ncbi:uncharacterized protein LOC106662913 [Cimex lectularius]|uniref:Ubiquitin-like domain-containing protein n=1 Tax=Cimex lectularius TaxID=79782 RepID=A0A8I6RFI0_CIMLE|nr:uncharacterized protein LOC106662913 [Cimex lectularius]